MLLNRTSQGNDQTIAEIMANGMAAMDEKNWVAAKDHFLKAVHYFSVTPDKPDELYFALTRLAAALTQLKYFWAAIHITHRVMWLVNDHRHPNYALARRNRARLYDAAQQRHLARADHEWLATNDNVPTDEKLRSRLQLGFLAKKQRRYDDYVKETILAEKLLAQLPTATDQQRHGLEKQQMFSYLQKGDYKKGFAYYENRFHFAGAGFHKQTYHRDDKKFLSRIADNPRIMTGKILLVVGDQGLGDNIMFARFLPLLHDMIKKYCKKIIFAPRIEQAKIFASNELCNNIEVMKTNDKNGEPSCDSGGDSGGDLGGGPVFDYWVQLTSLPFHLGIDETKMPYSDIPYLQFPSPQKNLPPHDSNKKNIALVWATGQLGEGATERSIPLPAMAPLLAARANFFSFQMGERQADIARHGFGAIVHDLSPLINDFSDTAGLLKNIDLVISVDTSLAHLAAALGKRVFLLSPYLTDWKWRDHHHQESWWYPRVVKIFHQAQENTWQEPLLEVKNNLNQFLRNGS